jgi:hypothetical protein
MKYKLGDRVKIVNAGNDVEPWLGLVGTVVGTCEGWGFPYNVVFEKNGDETEFKEEELEVIEDEI